MAYTNDSIRNFSSGELSPKVRGRSALAIYQNGCERLLNFIAETQGPARFRTGTQFAHHTRLNKIAFLIQFQFNDEQSYLLEFTDQMMRIYKDDAIIVESAKTITGATQADPVVITSVAHGYNNGDEIFIDAVVGMTELNGKSYLVANKNADDFELTDVDGVDIDGTGFTAYSSGGEAARIVEVASPFLEAELFEIKMAQNADVMFLVHTNHAPYKLTRTSHVAWTLTTFSRTNDPFTGAGNYPGAVAFYEGRLWYGRTGNNPESIWGSRAPDSSGNPRYTDHTTGSNADDAVVFTLAPVNGKVDVIRWLAGTSNFLGVGTFGGITKVTGSRSDEAITPSSVNAKPIDAFGCENILPITSGGITIYVQRGGLIIRSLEYDVSIDNYVSVDRNLVSDHMTESGIVQLAFQSSRPDVLWAVRGDGVLLGLTFKQREDVSGWHRHVIGGTDAKVLSVGVIPQPNNFDELWAVVERTINGATRRYVEFFSGNVSFPDSLDFFTNSANETEDLETFKNALYERQKEYIHVDSALSFDGSARGTVASASVTPAAVTGDSVVFTASASVFTSDDVGNEIRKKAIDGVGSGRAVIIAYTSGTEVTAKILKDFDSADAIPSGYWYLTFSTLTGLEHLEGETVAIIADGGNHPTKSVSGGAVTLNYETSVAHIGLQYTGRIKTMAFEGNGGTNGPAQSKPKNVDKLVVRFLNTLGGRVGTDPYRMEDVYFRSTSDISGRPPPVFSGLKEVYVSDSWETEKHIYVSQESPLPCVVQSIDIFIDTSNE